jgi:large subunit ribosomal protein L15
MDLSSLSNTSRPQRNIQRVGRGIGSHRGKTCGRGQKGAGSRSGYKRRWGKEGGQLPLFRKLPCKGFSNSRFKHVYNHLNLNKINQLFEDGEEVNEDTLRAKGYFKGAESKYVKLLGKGEISKKVSITVDSISESAKAKLEAAGITFTIIGNADSEVDGE